MLPGKRGYRSPPTSPPTICYSTKFTHNVVVTGGLCSGCEVLSRTNHDSELPSCCGHSTNKRQTRARNQLLVELGQLSPHHYWSFTKYLAHIAKSAGNPVWGFEERERVPDTCSLAKPRLSVFSPSRCEPEDRQRLQRKPGGDRGGEGRACPWYRIHRDTPVDTRPDQLDARVRNARRPGVRDKSNRLAALQPRQDLRHPRPRVVLVEAQRWRRNRVMREQTGRAPRILRGHDVGLPEDAQRPERDVLEVADGRGDHEQGTGHRAGVYCTIQRCALPDRRPKERRRGVPVDTERQL